MLIICRKPLDFPLVPLLWVTPCGIHPPFKAFYERQVRFADLVTDESYMAALERLKVPDDTTD